MSATDYENIKKFAYHLFEQMINDENPVISPVSAYLTLAMAGCGADGTTKDEFYNVLGENMEALAGNIKNNFSIQGSNINLSISNAAWIDKRFMVNNEWLDNIKHLADAQAFQAELFTEETMDAVNKWSREKTNGMIDLKLPRFEVVFDKVLNESLINMGLAECFDIKNADFTSIGKARTGGTLYVELVRQKAKIIVNEYGTEASAVSELLGALRAVYKVKKLYFNEPFLYMIMDTELELPLFIGIMDNPIS